MNMKDYATANNLLKELAVWKMMRDRCYNTGNGSYKNFGGRGVKVCSRWDTTPDGFINFVHHFVDKVRR